MAPCSCPALLRRAEQSKGTTLQCTRSRVGRPWSRSPASIPKPPTSLPRQCALPSPAGLAGNRESSPRGDPDIEPTGSLHAEGIVGCVMRQPSPAIRFPVTSSRSLAGGHASEARPQLARAAESQSNYPRSKCQFYQEAFMQEMGRPVRQRGIINMLEAVHLLSPQSGAKVPIHTE